MKLIDLMKEFCEQFQGYSLYENYSGRCMFNKRCVGIVVDKDCSYMNMLIHLTHFLEDRGFEDAELALSNPAIDNMGLDTIVYWKGIQAEE